MEYDLTLTREASFRPCLKSSAVDGLVRVAVPKPFISGTCVRYLR